MGSAVPGPRVVDLDATGPDLTGDQGPMWEAGREPAGVLSALVRLGAPVPAGFILTPAAWAQLARTGGGQDTLWEDVRLAVKRLEARSGLTLGDPARPLLLTVHADTSSPVTSPAPATVVGIGMDDAVADGLSRHGAVSFARATYARLAQTYDAVVLENEYVEILVLPIVPEDPGPGSDIGDRILARKVLMFCELAVHDAVQPGHFVAEAGHSLLVLRRRIVQEVVRLARHRPEAADLPEHPLQHPVLAAGRLLDGV